ncbi:hypothetical protein EVAR_35655_1 [Eumeta japonica]|uniref:Uncharacterized protein n=1 Tax=Eumeta variegata TaxID=151549 RepID=A0A4C1VFX5_EUMVA|nr:hypothetical protein EVAR_35655_1 [Eumeta japonica]
MPESRVTSVQTMLARRAALAKKTSADYDRFPLSHAKKVIRAASLEELQKQYAERSTGEIIKCFYPRIEQGYRVLRQIENFPSSAYPNGPRWVRAVHAKVQATGLTILRL